MDKKDMPRRREAMELRIRRTMAALEKNNMSAYYAPESADAVRIVEELLGEGDVISCGGSVTLDASGVKALMRSGKYDFLDRDAVETDAERQAIYRRTFSADAFLTSSNAITERGELFNIDGGGNRVAAMLFGPKKVLGVAGCNKLVRDLNAAKLYVKAVSVPANALRIVWIMTIFQMDRTLSTLFLSYPVSWLITALAHFICYLIVHRRFMKKHTLEPQP